MDQPSSISTRISKLVEEHNRKIAIDAGVAAGTGVLFSLLVFGLVFSVLWFYGGGLSRAVGLSASLGAAICTCILFAVALWSAWHRVDPAAGQKSMSDREFKLMLLSQIAPGVMYVNPRLASVGFATMLLGGPENLIEAYSLWKGRLASDEGGIESAARLLPTFKSPVPVENVRDLAPAVMLKALGLIRIANANPPLTLSLTEKGEKIVSRGNGGQKTKRSRETGTSSGGDDKYDNL